MLALRSNQRSKDHHYVPKAILRNFCFSGNTIYYLTKNRTTRNVEERNIASIMKRRHYNSQILSGGEYNDGLEKFYATAFDNFIPGWIDHFEHSLKNKINPNLSGAERDRFVQFFYNHIKRNPDFIEPIAKVASRNVFHADLVGEMREKFPQLIDKQIEYYLKPETQEMIAGNSRVANFSRQSEEVLDRLSRLNIFVAEPQRENKQFIVASNPVVRFENYPSQQLGEQGVELWTTLTPKIAVGLAKIGDQDKVITLGEVQVRKINCELAKQSSSIASNVAKLLYSLSSACW